jgi:hypothetical protein
MTPSSDRTYPLQKPEGHKPPVPRWQLTFGDSISTIHIAYIGLQQHSASTTRALASAIQQTTQDISQWVRNEEHGPATSESFEVIDGDDNQGSQIWVCYWADETAYRKSLEMLSPSLLHARLPPNIRGEIGIWLETFSLPVTRLETNYSGLDYLPGLARLPDTATQPHELTAYWGAARDRIPASAHDLFTEEEGEEEEEQQTQAPSEADGKGKHLVGSNTVNMVYIRSGQFWENCNEQETEAYETKLEPTLEAGLRYLWENREAGGAMGLRYLRNTTTPPSPTPPQQGSQPASRKLKETCAAGFFTSLSKLEGWAKTHKSHLAIYNGAMRHAKIFGDDRRFRTWHEVGILKGGEGRFEYVNCLGNTGMIRSVSMGEEKL